jgi:predicted LPLAT superfamily acyltransferase
MVLLAPVVLYFYATAGEQRRASLEFLERAFAAHGMGRRPSHRDGYRHFLSFARRAVDNLAAWTGRLTSADVVPTDGLLDELVAQPAGALFIVSHHGNVDVSRASLDGATRRRVVVLMHTRHAESYNRVLREFNPEAALNIFQVTDMGPDVAIHLQQRIEQGDWLFIAGDRTPVGGGRAVKARFLGAGAEFPQGPYLLAALLGCPVYLFFCRRDGARYVVTVERFADRLVLPRGGRAQAMAAYAEAYASRLEKHVLEDPLQWYNFYDFWQPARTIDMP